MPHLLGEPFLLYLRVDEYFSLICSSKFSFRLSKRYLNAPFCHSVSYFKYILLKKTFMRRFEFNLIIRLLIYSTMRQLTYWVNIGFGPRWFIFWMALVVFRGSMGLNDLKINFLKRILEIQLTCNEVSQESGGIFPWFILDTWNVFKD